MDSLPVEFNQADARVKLAIELAIEPGVGERLRLATAEGYAVTEEEIESASAILSDAELHTVTGAGGGVGRGTAQDLIEYDGMNYCQCRY